MTFSAIHIVIQLNKTETIHSNPGIRSAVAGTGWEWNWYVRDIQQGQQQKVIHVQNSNTYHRHVKLCTVE